MIIPPDCIVKFEASWCTPCRQIAPFVKKIADSYSVPLVAIDVDLYPEIAEMYGVISVPTVIRLRQSVETGRVTGTIDLVRMMAVLS